MLSSVLLKNHTSSLHLASLHFFFYLSFMTSIVHHRLSVIVFFVLCCWETEWNIQSVLSFLEQFSFWGRYFVVYGSHLEQNIKNELVTAVSESYCTWDIPISTVLPVSVGSVRCVYWLPVACWLWVHHFLVGAYSSLTPTHAQSLILQM